MLFFRRAYLGQHLQEMLTDLRRIIIIGGTDSFSVGGFLLVAQPLVIALALPGWILNDGVSVLDANSIAESADCLGDAPEDPELN